MYGSLVVGHPFDGIVIHIAKFVANKKLLSVSDSIETQRGSLSQDWLEGDASYRTWLLDLEFDALFVKAPEA